MTEKELKDMARQVSKTLPVNEVCIADLIVRE